MSSVARFPWITAAVCVPAAMLLVAARGGWIPMGVRPGVEIDLGDALQVVELGARSTALVGDADERWRLLTAHFVHTSWLHLVFNVAFLFPVGGALEQIVRRSDYAAMMLVAMVGSALCSLVFTPQVSAGASGVVFAVLAAAVITGIRHRDRLGPHIRHHFGWWVLPFLLITLAVTLGNPSVDHANHVGGLVAGVAFAPFMRLRLPAVVERGSAPNVLALAACALGLLVAPAVARGGAPSRVDVGGGWSATLPSAWTARYGPTGELEWAAAGGLVVFTVGDAPEAGQVAHRRWYLDHRLAPGGAVGRSAEIEELRPDAALPLPEGSLHLRFALRREQTPMIRDVVFLPPVSPGQRSVVLSLEVPRRWAGRYDETRDRLVGSLRAPRPASGVTRISVAAIE